MKHIIKQVALLLAGILATSVLLSCKSNKVSPPTDTTTTVQEANPTVPKEILSPEELYELLLNTSDFTVESKWEKVEGNSTKKWSYIMQKDGNLIQTEYSEPPQGTDAVVNYCDLSNSRYYEFAKRDWIFIPQENTFFADGTAAFLRDISPIDGTRDWKDENYNAYNPEKKSYSMKSSVLKEVFAENGWDAPPDRYSMTFTKAENGYLFVYTWREGVASMKMRTEIRFEDNGITLPKAENDPIAETPYTGESIDTMLTGLRKIDLSTEMVQFYTLSFSPWEGEEAEHLFDGVKTYEQWYYNEDGTLKEGAFPESGEGGGPGKCAGMIGDYAQFIFRFPLQPDIAAYVLTNANDNEEFGHRTPVRWALYGTNDVQADDPDTALEADWVLIDYVWDGGMSDENFFSGGYRIDPENCDRYYSYCLEIQATSGYQFQLGELEFYVDY